MKSDYQENSNQVASAALTANLTLGQAGGDLDRVERDLAVLAPLKPPDEKTYVRDRNAVSDPRGEEARIKDTLRGAIVNLDRAASRIQELRERAERLAR